MKVFVLAASAAIAGLSLTGCRENLYGKADRYDQFARPDFEVVMPANAPFISEQFVEGGLGGKNHLGIDIWNKHGSDIIAAAPGTVARSFYEPAFGHQVVIDHGPGEDGVRILTHYKHLHERTARVGQTLKRGEKLGTMGATGAMGMLVHLHFEVQRDEPNKGIKAYDPNLFWVDGVGRVTCFDRTATYPDRPFRITYPVRCRGM